VKTVLGKLDADKDGKVTAEELEAVGLDGLPNFEHMGAEGHHYDVESGKCACLMLWCLSSKFSS
jgi:nucleobindin